MANRSTKPSTSFRLSDEARELQRALSVKLGISISAVVELATRRLAEVENIQTARSPIGIDTKPGRKGKATK